MRLSVSDLGELADLAVVAAAQAGKMIAGSRPTNVEHKSGGASLASQVVTEIDRRAENLILEVLAPTLERFELGLLTEESEDNRGRLSTDYFWCIDPLDGTLPFIEGTPGYAVSIALVAQDGTPWIGVVCDPVESATLSAIKGAGVFRNGGPWSPEATRMGALSVFADRSFVERDDHEELLNALRMIARDLGLDGIQLHPARGAVMNAWGVLTHSPACYFKFPGLAGGGSLWDFAATACLFYEAGAIATDMQGAPLDLNRADSTFMNHRGALFATDAALAERIRALNVGEAS